MNILWITFAPIMQQNGILTSNLASARYRVIIPAKALAAKDYQHTFFATPNEFNLIDIKSTLDKQDVIIFSKSFNAKNEKIASYAKQNKIKIIFDICDNHFESPKFSQHYKNMVNLADKIVVNTPIMAEIVKQYTNRDSFVIPDPYEFQQGQPRFKPQSTGLNLLWFGSHTNLDSLQAMIPTLVPLSQQIPLKLHIVTAANMGVEQACQQFNTQLPHFKLFFSEWSLMTTQKAVQNADIVLIPSLPNARKAVKSPNRLIESLWSGRFVVAHPLPSYQEFAQWTWINEDLPSGIIWGLQNPKKIVHNIKVAQEHIMQHFSAEKVGEMWGNVLGMD